MNNINKMNKNTNFYLCNLSSINITFLNDIFPLKGKRDEYKLFKKGFYHYFRLDDANDFIYSPKIDYTRIRDFLEILDPDKAYIVYPLLISSPKLSNTLPVIRLSKPILVSRDSDHRVLITFFIKQIKILLFEYEIENIQGLIALKYKPIIIKNVCLA
jgi:hypothetical protein